MKTKNKLMSTLCVGILLILLISIKTSVAAPPSWVGVEAGDKIGWKATVYPDTFNELDGDLSGIPYTGPSYPAQSIGLSIEVLDVSDQLYDAYFDIYFVNITVIAKMSMPGLPEEVSPPIGIVVPRNDTLNYFITIFEFLDYYMIGGTGFLIVANDLDWSQTAEDLETVLPSIPELYGIPFNVSARTSGLEFYFEGGSVNGGELDTITGSVDYNEDGVLKSGVIRYGGAKLATIGPSSEDQIPGYEIHITLGITAACSVGLIIYFKKKK